MINGIINVYKEKGYTSHDVVAKLRGIVGQRKIGHTGTLDPDAEGVLPVCLGRATKLCDMLTDKNKTYEAVLLFGKTTDTQDITGKVLEEQDTSLLTEEKVKDCIQGYIGEYEQLPPMYSAVKVNGRKLYELARKGIEVERKKRKVRIFDIKISKIDLPRVHMEVKCSKGTYIRTLCHDIGQTAGTGACMEALKRTRVSRFEVEESLTLSRLEEYKNTGKLMDYVIPIDAMFSELPELVVAGEHAALAYNGNPLRPEYMTEEKDFEDGQAVRVYDKEMQFIGIYRYLTQKQEYRLEKMFFISEEKQI